MSEAVIGNPTAKVIFRVDASKLVFNRRLLRAKVFLELFCFEVKLDSIYSKADYISLLVNASILNVYLRSPPSVSYREFSRDSRLPQVGATSEEIDCLRSAPRNPSTSSLRPVIESTYFEGHGFYVLPHGRIVLELVSY